MHKNGRNTITLAMVLLLAAPLLAAEAPEVLAKRILEAVDRPVGLAHLPRCGNGTLALALADADPSMVVHGQDADYTRIQAAREKADERGYYGRRVWFDQGDLKRLLPVGNSCDLIIMTGLREKDLTPELAKEICRILHPWYGMALLGGNLPRAKFVQWGEHFKVSGVSVQVSGQENANFQLLASSVSGCLLKAEKPALPGADNWSHFWHGPGNNPVSTDTAFSTPETIQWTGMPRITSKTDCPIVANGRVFMLWNGHVAGCYSAGDPVLPGENVELPTHGWNTVGLSWAVNKDEGSRLMQVRGPLLEVRAVGSGVRLWHRRMSPMMWMQHQRSVIVADGDRLLVADGNTLRVLDQATGEERQSREVDYEEIKWIAVADGYIALLSGPTIDIFPERMRRSSGGLRRSRGRLLTVLDGTSLEPLWEIRREQGPEEFDPRSAAIDQGKLFITTEGTGKPVRPLGAWKQQGLDEAQLTADGVRAEAYDLADGKPLWQQATDIKRRLYTITYENDTMLRHPVVGYAMAGLYIISASEDDRVLVFAQDSGELLRTEGQARGRGMRCFMYYKGLLWSGREGVDPMTNEQRIRAAAGVGGCGHFTAAPQGIVGQPGLTWDAATEQSVPFVLSKSQCAASSFVANGLIWRLPNYKGRDWRGWLVRGARERELPAPGPRLVRSAAGSTAAVETPAGWTSHRGDASRSASAAVSVADTATRLWSVASRHPTQLQQPKGPLIGPVITPVPPVTAGDVVISADNDGIVQALDLETGNVRWRTQTGGRIESSPTVWQDRVFVGSTDGRVYAFALADGRELWRLRVAPEEGRMTLYDQLGSRWPVLASPLVVDGTVFVVAGALEAIDGVYAVAAEAMTGELLWERTDWHDPAGEDLNPSLATSGAGQLCWDARTREVAFSSGTGLPVRFASDTGEARAAFGQGLVAELEGDRKTWRKWRTTVSAGGQEIGMMAPDWLVWGHSYVPLEEGGRGRFPIVNVQGSIPSWDDTDVLLTFATGRHKPHVVVQIPKARFTEFLASRIQDLSPAAPGLHLVKPLPQVEALGGWQTAFPSKYVVPRMTALVENAALVLVQEREDPQLIAFNRADGTRLWTQPLPAPAVRHGLAVAADGSIVLALQDGRIVRIGARE